MHNNLFISIQTETKTNYSYKNYFISLTTFCLSFIVFHFYSTFWI